MMKCADFEAFCRESKDISVGDLSTAYFRSQGVGFFNIEDDSINVTGKELQRWMLWCVYYGRPKEEYPLAETLTCHRPPSLPLSPRLDSVMGALFGHGTAASAWVAWSSLIVFGCTIIAAACSR
ncbi:hypothetical protein [Bifidobacterium sp. AGR2158]|uniref:hypothetical protein n=1 Tax=Bifidobacterium sp. AGR2158 TaxID=1280675 RepID=UPI00047BA083|nr:hypothetical protein [Bifidobacterium sp. AGR2158]